MDTQLVKRNSSLDIARIIAIFAVVMIHCSAPFVAYYEPSTTEFIFGNIFDSISRIGVPLFLMISGSLFLDECKEIKLKNILTKNVKNLAIITLFWATAYSLVYNFIFSFITNKKVNIKALISGILNGHYHMWYLYVIIGLYIITPFLKKIVCKDNKKMVIFFIIASIVIEFSIPAIKMTGELGLNVSFITEWINNFRVDFFGGYITYFLVGWYIVHIGIRRKLIKYIIYFLGVLSLALTILYVNITGDYNNAYENIGLLVFMYSTSVFLAINNIKLNLTEKTVKRLTRISKLIFGVYIIHIIILSTFTNIFVYDKNPFLYIIMSFVIVLCCSFMASYIISKIPVIKKLIKA